jgi:outer membrane protein insertion porin family
MKWLEYKGLAGIVLTGLMLVSFSAEAAIEDGTKVKKEAEFESFEISDIKVIGLQRVELGTFFTYLNIRVGETIDQARIPSIIRGIYQSGSFDDITVMRDGSTMFIQVKERPTIATLTFEGNSAIKTEDLERGLKASGLAKGEVLDRALLTAVQQDLERQYFAYGKYSVRVKHKVVRLPRNRVDIRFDIVEGDAAEIKKINIVGNNTFDEEEILSQFELSTGGWFSLFTDDNQYAKEKLAGDLETLSSFYLDRGYLKMEIVSTQVAITPERDGVYITINIDEGKKYSIKELKFTGDTILDEETLRQVVPIRAGDTYSGAIVTFAEETITRLLGFRGYAFPNIQTLPDVDEDNQEVTLTIYIDPSKRTYINRINFAGNLKTDDHVLRREMRLMESGTMSTDLVERSKLRLERLPYMEEVSVETPKVPGTDDMVDINFAVKERPSGSIGGGLAFSDLQGLMLNANITQDNFMGSGNQVALALNTSKAYQSINFNYTDPYYTVDAVSRGWGAYIRKTDFGELNIAGQTLDSYGANLSFGIPVNEITRLNFGVGLQDSELSTGTPISEQIRDFYTSVGQDIERDFDYDFTLVNLTAGWVRNSLNRGLFPDAGTSQIATVDFSIPGSDMEYYKLNYKIDHYVPIARGWSFLFRANLSFGDAYGSGSGSGDAQLPYFENFYAGGSSTMRGFDRNTIGPREIFRLPSFGQAPPPTDPVDSPVGVPLPSQFDTITINRRSVGGNARALGGVELIFPTPFAEENRSVRTSAFIDIGNVWNTNFDLDKYAVLAPQEFEKIPDFSDPGTYRVSAGISIQWISPMGPLIFSLSKTLKQEEQDETESFSFNIGRTF